MAGGAVAHSPSPYHALDPQRIIRTAEMLEQRVGDRFPDAGLRRVAQELVVLSRDLALSAKALEEPIWWLRGLTAVAMTLGGVALLSVAIGIVETENLTIGAGTIDLIQGLESSINTIILAALGMLALMRIEERIKRKGVFRELHLLRTLIHVIDMHQLTKDPSVLTREFRPTEHSPARITNTQDLARYLDYCTEMLSITGKLAALFAQSVNDEGVINAVNDIENLGSNLARKIWQKITMVEQIVARGL